MSLYVVTLTTVLSGDIANPFVNVFTYDVNDILPSSAVAQSLADGFDLTVLDDTNGWKAIVSDDMLKTSIVVTSPFNPAVLGVNVVARAGLRTGSRTNRFVAWEFKATRTRADMRHGFKRFGVLTEDSLIDGQPSASLVTILNAFEIVLNSELEVDDGGSTFAAQPVIVKRIKYTAPSGKPAYRFPNSPTEYVFYPANFQYDRVTTQNSRKA